MNGSRGTISEGTRELQLLEVLEKEPEIKQVDLAARLGVAVGKAQLAAQAAGGQGVRQGEESRRMALALLDYVAGG